MIKMFKGYRLYRNGQPTVITRNSLGMIRRLQGLMSRGEAHNTITYAPCYDDDKDATITFDDFEINDPDYEEYRTTGWTYICQHCMAVHGINHRHIDESGGGDPDDYYAPRCSVKGCDNVAIAYLDIPDTVPAPEKHANEWAVPLKALQE